MFKKKKMFTREAWHTVKLKVKTRVHVLLCYICMSHVTHERVTYEEVLSHMHELCDTWMSHGTQSS